MRAEGKDLQTTTSCFYYQFLQETFICICTVPAGLFKLPICWLPKSLLDKPCCPPCLTWAWLVVCLSPHWLQSGLLCYQNLLSYQPSAQSVSPFYSCRPPARATCHTGPVLWLQCLQYSAINLGHLPGLVWDYLKNPPSPGLFLFISFTPVCLFIYLFICLCLRACSTYVFMDTNILFTLLLMSNRIGPAPGREVLWSFWTTFCMWTLSLHSLPSCLCHRVKVKVH